MGSKNDGAPLVCKVAIVGGGGACGLAFNQRLRMGGHDVRAFEAEAKIGGLWARERRQASPLYDNLRTNLPKELMCFPGEPFEEGGPSFVQARVVEEYLERFAEAHHLGEVIQFNSRVRSVTPIENNRWLVRIESTRERGSTTPPLQEETFDAVVLANGHFNSPYIPEHLRCRQWLGKVAHSMFFKNASRLKGKVVVVVGALSSGSDMARIISQSAAETHICDPLCPESSQDLTQLGPSYFKIGERLFWRPRLERLVPHSRVVEFERGNPLQADYVLFCTGYEFNFDMLPEGILDSRYGQRVSPLFNQLVHVEYPTLFFAGLLQPSVPFPLFTHQAEYVARLLSEPSLLPSVQERRLVAAQLDQDIAHGRIDPSKVHALDQWGYQRVLARSLCDSAMLQRLDKLERFYKYLGKIRGARLPGTPDTYRDAVVPKSLL